MLQSASWLLVFAVAVHAIDLEFVGFVHFKNWNGGMTDIEDSSSYKLPPNFPALPSWTSICAGESRCDSFHFGAARIKDSDSAYDIYLGANVSNLPQSICAFEDVTGCDCLPNSTARILKCDNDFAGGGGYPDRPFNEAHILNTYALPPDIIHSECLKNTNCIGFRVKNDQSSGDLLQAITGEGQGFFML